MSDFENIILIILTIIFVLNVNILYFVCKFTLELKQLLSIEDVRKILDLVKQGMNNDQKN